MTPEYGPFPFVRPMGLDAPEPEHAVVVVGAGPVGLTLAIDLALRGVRVVVLDDNDVVSTGSRAICWAKRSLEIFDRLGVGQPLLERGVTWQVGRTHRGEREVFAFDLLPEDGHRMPAFINLQQYHVEAWLVARAREAGVELRFRNRVTGVEPGGAGVRLEVGTPEGAYALQAAWVVACDGARSPLRGMLGLEFEGELFEERFLIADIRMKADVPPDRRFWFEPPFHDGQSALMHKQPDDIWRVDLQLGWEADPVAENSPERILPRIRKVVGGRPFELDWHSVYTFQCRRLARFVHGRVIFCGDSAHVVSPFGARGGNGGVQDADGLGWRLAAVLGGAPEALLERYDLERVYAADENIRNSSRATRFMSPEDGAERVFRDAVLDLAGVAEFARPMVNSGRLSRPATYPSAGPDDPALPRATRPGAPAADAPVDNGWLLGRLSGGWTVLGLGREPPVVVGTVPVAVDAGPHVAARYLGTAGSAVYLVRPDQHVAARWQTVTPEAVAAETARVMAGVA